MLFLGVFRLLLLRFNGSNFNSSRIEWEGEDKLTASWRPWFLLVILSVAWNVG